MSTNRPEPFAEGTFTKTPFSHILIYLMERKLTGTLETADNKDNVTIYFREGMPAKVKSSVKGKGLGQILLDLGQINQDQLRACQQEMSTKGGFAGEILMRQGAVEAAGLMRGLRSQILLKLMDVFAMVDARYAFYKDVNLLVGEGRDELFQVDTYPVLMAGARTHGARMKMEKVLDAVEGRWISVDSVDVLKRFRLNAPEQALCAELLSKGKTMEEIIQNGRHNRQVVRSTLYVLLLTKEAVISDVPPATGTPSIAPGPRPKFDSISPPSAEEISSDPKIAALRGQIQEKASVIARQNYYEMLGIPLGAPTEEIRKAFFKLAKTYHPDRAGTTGTADLRETLQYVFSNLSEAHATLLDPETREEYVEAISAGIKRTSLIPAAHAEREVREALDAETLYQKGLVLLRRSPYDKALEFFRDGQAPDRDKWESERIKDRETAVAQISSYLEFAWMKANDSKGLSAQRSLAHFKGLLYLVGPECDEIRAWIGSPEHYAFYGKPALVKVSEFVAFDWKAADDDKWTNQEGEDGITADEALGLV